ncbi:MAG: helix-turn-helix transcriptional regulator [Desulfomonilaceae bacterium]
MRGKQIVRQWKIIRLVETRRQGMSGMDLARELNISLRTVYRDLDAIHEAGFPLYPDREGRNTVWKMLDTFRKDFALPLTDVELMALKLSRDILGMFDNTIFLDGIETLFQKVKSTMFPETLTDLDNLSGSLMNELGPHNDLRGLKDAVKALSQATASKERLRVDRFQSKFSNRDQC